MLARKFCLNTSVLLLCSVNISIEMESANNCLSAEYKTFPYRFHRHYLQSNIIHPTPHLLIPNTSFVKMAMLTYHINAVNVSRKKNGLAQRH